MFKTTRTPIILSAASALTLMCAPVNAQAKPAKLADEIDQANRLYHAHHLDEARQLYSDALDKAKSNGSLEPQIGTCLNALGLIAEQQNQMEQAGKFYKDALRAKEAAVGDKDPQVVPVLENFAHWEEVTGHPVEAEAMLQRAVKIRETQSADSPELALSLTRLAHFYRDRQRFQDAEPLLKQSLKIFTAKLPSNDPAIALATKNLAAVYESEGKYADAEEQLKAALKIATANGNSAELIASCANGLSDLLRHQEKFEAAEPYSLQVVDVLKNSNPPASAARVMIAVSNLATIYKEEGKLPEAKATLQELIDLISKSYGADSDKLMAPVTDLAIVANLQGDNETADKLLQRAVELGKKAFGTDNVKVAIALSNLAEQYRQEGKFTDAESTIKQSVEIRVHVQGKDSPELGGDYNDMALIYKQSGNNADAEAQFKNSIDAREKAVETAPGDLGTSMNNLARLYRDEKRYADAEPLYKRALELREKAFGPNDTSVAATLRNYAILLRATGRQKEANAMDQRAQSIEDKH